MVVTDSGGTRTHVYSYDSIYQLTSVDYPAELSYLATDTTFNYDAAGNRSSVIDGSGTSTYTTNSLNQYTAAGTASYQYDSSGNMVHDQNYAYGYDPENRLVAVRKNGSLPPVSISQALDSPLTYTTGGDAPWLVCQTAGHGDYDCVYSNDLGANQSNWLQTTVTGPGTFSFWWMAPSSDLGGALTFSIDGTGRDSISGDQTTWQQHTYTITGSGTHTLRWTFTRSDDENNRGAGYVDAVQWTGSAAPAPEPPANDWHRLTYTYDPSGRRIAKSYDGEVITSYVYDGDNCIAEYDASSNLRRKYIFGPCTDEPISMTEAVGSYAGTYYYHFDALGSVVALTNSSGDTVEAYEYSVFGQVGASDPNHPNRFMFTGREFDKETGLYYYRARYYNPQIGRFLQTDPIAYGDGMNLYRYCHNNALTWVDPLGLSINDRIAEGYVVFGYAFAGGTWYVLYETPDGRTWNMAGIGYAVLSTGPAEVATATAPDGQTIYFASGHDPYGDLPDPDMRGDCDPLTPEEVAELGLTPPSTPPASACPAPGRTYDPPMEVHDPWWRYPFHLINLLVGGWGSTVEMYPTLTILRHNTEVKNEEGTNALRGIDPDGDTNYYPAFGRPVAPPVLPPDPPTHGPRR